MPIPIPIAIDNQGLLVIAGRLIKLCVKISDYSNLLKKKYICHMIIKSI